jgi:fatty acyl-CoA reductase
MKTYEKLHKFTGAISFFCTRQWKFSNQNVQQLWNVISEEDRKIFDFNICNLNWDRFLGESLRGVRNFLLKDDPNKLSDAIKKRNRYVFSGPWCI